MTVGMGAMTFGWHRHGDEYHAHNFAAGHIHTDVADKPEEYAKPAEIVDQRTGKPV